MSDTPKPFTPAELSEIERAGSLREVTAERLVATVKERDETIAKLRACPPGSLTLVTPDEVARLVDCQRYRDALERIERYEGNRVSGYIAHKALHPGAGVLQRADVQGVAELR